MSLTGSSGCRRTTAPPACIGPCALPRQQVLLVLRGGQRLRQSIHYLLPSIRLISAAGICTCMQSGKKFNIFDYGMSKLKAFKIRTTDQNHASPRFFCLCMCDTEAFKNVCSSVICNLVMKKLKLPKHIL